MNSTFPILNNAVGYVPPIECVQWCVEQKVVAYNNLEIYSVMIVAISSILLTLYPIFKNYPTLERFAPYCIYWARMSLYAFFFVYFVYLRAGV